jgi:hypothetical protein
MTIKCNCKESVESCKMHNVCVCGGVKKQISEYCKKCYNANRPKYSCEKCGKKRKKTLSPMCRKCFYDYQTSIISSDDRIISSMFYNCGERNKYNGVRCHARRLIKSLRLEFKCKCCNFSSGVQVCHIKSISSFDENSKLSEVNDIKNLILLCPNCHWLFDHGYNSLEKLVDFYKCLAGESNSSPPPHTLKA